MKLKLKDGKEIDVKFWDFAWKVFLANTLTGLILWIIFAIILMAMFPNYFK